MKKTNKQTAHSGMDQQKANELIHRCATILCLNVPPKIEFGIDNHSWIVGDKFKGVKLIPPGVHFIFYRYV
jgi:A1 cistron-splicing factor AAR2